MLLPEINERETRDNVIKLLEQYDSLCRLAGRQYEQSLTADYSLEPKGSGGISRPIENLVSRKVAAIQILENIYKALNDLNFEQKEMLWSHYVDKMTNEYRIEEKYNISVPTYYNHLRKAQLAFAEVYGVGELLVED